MRTKLAILVIPMFVFGMLVRWFWADAAQAMAFQTTAAEHKTIWSGVYTDAQAASGQQIFEDYCRGCHGGSLEGGASQGAPPLKGEKFMENWREDTLDSLFTKIKTTMPRRDSKVLNETETLNIVSYILRTNEFPLGTSPLDTSMLRAIGIERKDGPKPLPNYSMVQIVGCMAQEGDNWVLTNAGTPLRNRNSDKTTADELKAAQTRPLGAMTFRLQNLAMLGAFNPEVHKGHKMLAKGALIKQSSGERISITELEMLGPACPN